jgi:hypothetical protein
MAETRLQSNLKMHGHWRTWPDNIVNFFAKAAVGARIVLYITPI